MFAEISVRVAVHGGGCCGGCLYIVCCAAAVVFTIYRGRGVRTLPPFISQLSAGVVAAVLPAADSFRVFLQPDSGRGCMAGSPGGGEVREKFQPGAGHDFGVAVLSATAASRPQLRRLVARAREVDAEPRRTDAPAQTLEHYDVLFDIEWPKGLKRLNVKHWVRLEGEETPAGLRVTYV